MKILKDLLGGPNNGYWDLGRILAFLSSLAMIAGAAWNVLLGLPLELGPTGFGGGFAAVLTSAAALIYAKDRARVESVASGATPSPAAKDGQASPARVRKEPSPPGAGASQVGIGTILAIAAVILLVVAGGVFLGGALK
jgi:hypothetical protein